VYWLASEAPADTIAGAYPADRAGRQQLADELTANGLRPTQGKQHFDPDKIDKMAEAMSR
jgi:hypothetical protein